MKKMIVMMLTIVLIVLSAACANGSRTPGAGSSGETQQEESELIKMTLKINDEEVNVKWEDNESVRALYDLAAKGPITVDTSLYGGFEQVGELGAALPNNDVDTTTDPGDIVLYSGSSIVVFFGTNTWAYTRLGHIEDKSRDELRDMLGSNNAVLTITTD